MAIADKMLTYQKDAESGPEPLRFEGPSVARNVDNRSGFK